MKGNVVLHKISNLISIPTCNQGSPNPLVLKLGSRNHCPPCFRTYPASTHLTEKKNGLIGLWLANDKKIRLFNTGVQNMQGSES